MQHVATSRIPSWAAEASPAECLRVRSRASAVLTLTLPGFACAAVGLVAGRLPGWCWISLASITIALLSHGVQSLRHYPRLDAARDVHQRRAAQALAWVGAVVGVALGAAVLASQWLATTGAGALAAGIVLLVGAMAAQRATGKGW